MLSVAEAKVRLGILPANTAQDATITAVAGAALAIAEAYCRRKFALKAEVETFHHFRGRTLPLARYPIRSVTSVRSGAGMDLKHEDARGLGQIELDGMVYVDRLTVEYTGGFDPAAPPADLWLALWTIFDYLWAQTPGGGIAAGGGGGASAGAMKSFSIPGVLSIDYGNASASAGAGAGAGAGGAHIPPLAVSILDLYRREQA
jgi:hypothetical protein